MSDQKIKVGISVGDLNGIGGEVILKTFENPMMLDFCTPIIFASVRYITFLKKHFGLTLNFHGADSLDNIIPNRINVVNVWKEHVDIRFGEESKTAGNYAFKSLEAAAKALKNDEVDVLVTAPIDKNNIQSEHFNFPGHTDYLAKEFNGKSLMLMISEELRVGLFTDHVPLNEIVKNLTKERILDKIEIIHNTLKMDFGINKPKIAVLGINPHNGDKGVIGSEDDTILRPALEEVKKTGKLVFGPYAADSFFGSGNFQKFDAVIATYHDQGLIPFKTLSFGKGVNFTAGLEKIRTSPDHGTALDIAGKDLANPESFREAVFAAINIHREREEYKLLTANPLKITQKRTSSKKRY